MPLLLFALVCVLGVVGWNLRPPAGEAEAPAVAALSATGDGPRMMAASARSLEPVAGMVFEPRRDFESARDLYVYAQRLEAQAKAGDADAGWMLSRVYDYCAAFAADPVTYTNDTRAIAHLNVSTAAAMAAARTRVSQRCARFMPVDGLSRETVLDARQQAARLGSLPAEAALLAAGEPVSEEVGYRQALVERVMLSGDPQAFLALSTAMGLNASGSEAELGPVSGSWLSELAWQIAACQLGLDCSAQGNLMTAYCANGGVCSKDPSQDFPGFVLDAGVPRQGVDNLNEMVDTLLSRRRQVR